MIYIKGGHCGYSAPAPKYVGTSQDVHRSGIASLEHFWNKWVHKETKGMMMINLKLYIITTPISRKTGAQCTLFYHTWSMTKDRYFSDHWLETGFLKLLKI